MRVTRLIALGAAAVTLAASSLAVAQDKVSLRLNWYLGGLHVPFYYGKDKGYYAAEGIDLTINEGRGSANTVQVVAAGSDTFGLADSSSVVLTASKGADVKSVMSLLNTTGFSLVSLADAGIRTPKDLEGKKVAVTAGDPLGSLLQAVCKANNVDCAKISMVQVDPAASSGQPGAVVDGVLDGTPAASAGLQQGDVITAVDGQTVDSNDALTAGLHGHHAGDQVKVTWSDPSGTSHTATITLAEGPA